MSDQRLGKTYIIIDTSLPPNTLGRAELIKTLGPGHFLARFETGEEAEVYSCQLRRID